jgi:hemoglobin-like flavoprotein
MTARQIQLVRETYETISDMAVPVSMLFYGRLFQEYPAVRSMFHGDIREQARKFIEMIAVLVQGLGRGNHYRNELRAMGRRHVRYGVTRAHYAVVGEALLWALRHALERQFSTEAQLAWKAMIDDACAHMMSGAEDSADNAEADSSLPNSPAIGRSHPT